MTVQLQDLHPHYNSPSTLDESTFEQMWDLFCHIHRFWDMNTPDDKKMSQFWVFLNNRMKFNLDYLNDYQNAAKVITSMIAEHGEQAAYDKLFTDPYASIEPPRNRLARARQLVCNEFINLALVLSGVKPCNRSSQQMAV
jgi:hypothetical protein